MKSANTFSAWPRQMGNDTRSVPGDRGAPPSFFSVKSALTHHRPRAGGGMAIGHRALLAEAPPGLSPEGPTMPQAAIVGAVPSVSYFS